MRMVLPIEEVELLYTENVRLVFQLFWCQVAIAMLLAWLPAPPEKLYMSRSAS